MMNYSKQILNLFLTYIILFLSLITTSLLAQSDTTDFGKTPVIVEAEFGVPGSNLVIQVNGDVTYITTNSNYIG